MDSEGVERIFLRNRSRVFSRAYRLYGHEQDAENAVEEAFLSGLRCLEKFESEADFLSFVFRKVGRLFIDSLRYKGPDNKTLELHEDNEDGYLNLCAASWKTEFGLQDSFLIDLIEGLPIQVRQILQLKENGLTQGKIAEALGISKRTVGERMAEVKLLLNDRLAKRYSHHLGEELK